jgi:hypothetical protein
MNPRGLQSLTYNGHQLIADPSFMGDFCYGGISTTFKRSDGTTYNGATNWSSSSMDIDAKKVTLTFTWGTATCTYSKPISNRINFLVTLTNSTSDTLISATGKLLIFYTPTASPNVYYSGWSTQLGSIPLWTSFQQHAGPLLIDLSTVGKMAITNDNPVTSSSAVGGLSQYWYNQLFGLDWTIADPIGPSATGKLKTSMRFGSTSSTILGLAGDTYQRLDAQYPCQFNWTDRRLMGRDFLSSTTPHPADGENPRGWFNNDDSIDITSHSSRPTTARASSSGTSKGSRCRTPSAMSAILI